LADVIGLICAGTPIEQVLDIVNPSREPFLENLVLPKSIEATDMTADGSIALDVMLFCVSLGIQNV